MTKDEFRAWRQRMGWTQRQAAEAFGFTAEHVSRMEHGTKAVQRVTELACKALENAEQENGQA